MRPPERVCEILDLCRGHEAFSPPASIHNPISSLERAHGAWISSMDFAGEQHGGGDGPVWLRGRRPACRLPVSPRVPSVPDCKFMHLGCPCLKHIAHCIHSTELLTGP